VLVAEPNLKFLSTVLILLWPLCVVFPVALVSIMWVKLWSKYSLHDLTLFDDLLDLSDEDGADAHYR
jgi:hypothetical protein